MAHYVKCAVCGQTFNRDKHPFVRYGTRRYAHIDCARTQEENKSKIEKDKEALETYIRQLFNMSTINSKIQRQIKSYMKEYSYTYSGIHKTLKYFYEVKGGSVEKANGGIGIVPYIYDDAYRYYYNLWEAQQRNAGIKIQEYIPEEETIHIEQPQRKVRKRKIFSFLNEEE